MYDICKNRKKVANPKKNEKKFSKEILHMI